MTKEAKGSWIFGSLFAIFLFGVFVFGPPSLPDYKQQILAYISALLAAFFAVFFTGSLLLNAQLPMPGKWTVRAGAGLALFIIVLFWWHSPASPIGRTQGGAKSDAEGAGTSPVSTTVIQQSGDCSANVNGNNVSTSVNCPDKKGGNK